MNINYVRSVAKYNRKIVETATQSTLPTVRHIFMTSHSSRAEPLTEQELFTRAGTTYVHPGVYDVRIIQSLVFCILYRMLL